MAFRVKTRTIAHISGLLIAPALLSPPLFAQYFQYDAWHGSSRPPHIKKAGELGTLTIGETGISFEERYKNGKPPKHPYAWHWDYQDIQQLKISAKALAVLSYKDNKWKLGADREYHFGLVSEDSFEGAYQVLKTRLDQRFVAAIADTPASPLWELPAKHRVRFGGDEGMLQVGTSEIIYRSANKSESRTWRYEDIDNISSSGPFDLTFTTFEYARLDYGSRKQFNFELKHRLEETRYNDLWLRLNQSKGLQVLSSYRDAGADAVLELK